MMGSGKTSIGKILAKKISLPFYDSDNDIEDKLNIKISEIFEKYGESWFREQEEKICNDILKKEKFVLALGGGAITNKLIRDNIEKNSLLVYLKTDENILFERLKNDKSRPLLKGSNLKKKISSKEKHNKPAIQETASFRQFMADAQAAKDRQKKKIEDRKKKDAQFVDTKKHGVKFYDKKGSGRIKSGKKIYN